jgi:hypothetical protein
MPLFGQKDNNDERDAAVYPPKPLLKPNIPVKQERNGIKHIYKTTGVSNMTALTSLFHGFTPIYPKFTPESPQDHS